MNEEIDIVELLKRVKEGKAPKEIEIGGTEYRFCNNSRKIRSLYKTIQEGFIWTNYMTISLDTKIKILDKPKAINKKIEEREQNKNEIKKLRRKIKGLNTILGQFIDNSVSKDELKKIVDECIPKKENMITGEIEYTTNANANSFLTQEILKLLEDEEFE